MGRYTMGASIVVLVLCRMFILLAYAADCTQSAVVLLLTSKPDARSQNAASNLRDLCLVPVSAIKRSLAATKCLGPDARIFTEADAAILGKTIGKLESSTLKVLLPTIAALRDATPAVALGMILLPTPIEKDAIDTISRADSNSREDLIRAARSLLWDTNPSAFRALSSERKAAIAACVSAR